MHGHIAKNRWNDIGSDAADLLKIERLHSVLRFLMVYSPTAAKYILVNAMRMIFFFLILGVAGWILDTLYRSLAARKYTTNTVIPFFSLPYAIAGILMLFIFRISALPSFFQIILAVFASVIIEYFSGVFCVRILKRRLWDYSGHVLNIGGHIDLLHTVYWTILVIILWLINRGYGIV